MTDTTIFINFNKDYCKSPQEVFNSNLFKRILFSFITRLDKNETYWWMDFRQSFPYSRKELSLSFIDLFKLCSVYSYKDLKHEFLKERFTLIRFLEELYDYYRKFERYSIMYHRYKKGYENMSFVDADAEFNELIRSTYRRIYSSLKGESYKVYRQLAAATSAGIVIEPNELNVPYSNLSHIFVVSTVLMHVPFIVYPKNNKRKGVFKIDDCLKVNELHLNNSEFVCYPILVGNSLAFVYIHKDYTNLLISLANLFQPASDYKERKPDLIYIYGVKDTSLAEPVYYHDKETDIYIGIAPYSEEITYFGYMKKMLLTLHNSKCINEGGLPIHGAMASFVLKNHQTFNVCIMGDSGAGKSETLEALHQLPNSEILDINTIFDDMGTFVIKDNEVIAYGSETGAFVRLDDLDSSYAYRKIERSVFLSPDTLNARVIVPVEFYDEVIKGYKVDLFLYANNYEDKHGIKIFDNIDEAKKVFIEGKRKAAATTVEQGLLTSYFANPFGPVQQKEKCDQLIDIIFNKLMENNIPIGELYSRLSFDSKEGPKEASEALYQHIIHKEVK